MTLNSLKNIERESEGEKIEESKMGLNIQPATLDLQGKARRGDERGGGKKPECPSRYLTCDIDVFTKEG